MMATANVNGKNGRSLPEGWEWKTIGEVTLAIQKIDPSQKPDKEFTYLDIASIDNSVHKITEPKSYYGVDAPSRARQLVQANDILFSTVRTYLEKIAQVPQIYDGQIASTGFSVLRANELVFPKYLFYYSLTQDFLEPLNELQRGTSYPAVRDGDVRVQLIPVAPLPEQERIVNRIEELFSDLEAGVAALKRVRVGLKRYKASVLKAAVQGRLFGDVELGDEGLPVGWRWIKIKEAGKVQLGRQRAPQHHQGTHMRPYLRVANVFEDRIDLSDVKEMNFTPAEYEIYKLEYGDILLNEGQSPEFLGRPAMYKGELPGGCFQNTLIRFQAFDFADRHFALFVFRHYMHAGRFTQESQITTNMAHLSAGRFGGIEFPLPPLDEQQRIVAEVERRLSVIGEVESAVKVGIVRAGRLRQSVLKSAFEGRL
jgi:restriction endonuclease S subunit